jgi:hypothetical protein
MITHTRTYAILELSPEAYLEIRTKLLAAGYEHAFDRTEGVETIDVHGIALRVQAPEPSGKGWLGQA